MKLQAVALAVCCVLGSCWAQGGWDSGVWSVYDFPDPILTPAACGRPSPSFVCDPNNILPTADVEVIDETAKDVYNRTTVLCYDAQGSKRKGYLIMVAAMPKMNRTFTSRLADNRRTRYREAQFFSYMLGMYNWKHSTCNETTIILYSADDGVLYTSTQSTARAILTDQDIQDVATDLVIYHYPVNTNPTRAANAIKYLVRRYSDFFLAK